MVDLMADQMVGQRAEMKVVMRVDSRVWMTDLLMVGLMALMKGEMMVDLKVDWMAVMKAEMKVV